MGTKFTELNDAMREYHEVFGHELPPLPREPVLSDYYTPSDEQHYRELGFIALSMIGIGGVLYYLKSYAGINLTGYHPPREPQGCCTKMCAQPQGFCTTENAWGPGQ